jgi:chemosensory pili system protein ChpA (sensor histidine kinase/response regulator)
MSIILVVEDNLMIRELMRELLEREQYQVVEAGDGGEALAKLEEVIPDLVLMDIQLPKLDGYAVLHQLRRDRRFRSLPVIAVTAYAMRSDEEKARRAGFDNYLTKPVDRAVLMAMIRSLLARRKHRAKTRTANRSSSSHPSNPPHS